MPNDPWFADGNLRFAVGIEDTFIPQSRPGERPLDEYELMQHYRAWEQDLELSAEAGATMIRWGIPWYRICPTPNTWDWSWLDQVVDKMESVGLDLIADLVHYGTPLWLENEFANPDYPARVAEYGARVAERYRGRIRHYTPANEPLLNAMYCGEFGHWPPYLTGDQGFGTVLRGLTRGIVETQAAIAEVALDADFVHVEASFRFAGATASHAEVHEHLRNRAYVVQDLVMGRIDGAHPMAAYLSRNGFSDNDLEWARTNTAQPDVVGVNYYPQHSTEIFEDGVSLGGGPGELRPRLNAGTEGLRDVLLTFSQRYDKPVFLTETGFTGTVEERIDWMNASVQTVHEMRDEGVPIMGYTWWCTTDMVEWSYRPGLGDPMDYRLRMGLWALEADSEGLLERVRTPAADRFKMLSTGLQN